jgi:hypothetical protein
MFPDPNENAPRVIVMKAMASIVSMFAALAAVVYGCLSETYSCIFLAVIILQIDRLSFYLTK